MRKYLHQSEYAIAIPAKANKTMRHATDSNWISFIISQKTVCIAYKQVPSGNYACLPPNFPIGGGNRRDFNCSDLIWTFLSELCVYFSVVAWNIVGDIKAKRLSDLIVYICFTREDDIDLRKAVERLVHSMRVTKSSCSPFSLPFEQSHSPARVYIDPMCLFIPISD